MTTQTTEKKEGIKVDDIIKVVERLFVLPENKRELFEVAGLTNRQASALVMLMEKKTIKEISTELKSTAYTQNAYDAIIGGIKKIFRGIVLTKAISEDKEFFGQILNRAYNYPRFGIKKQEKS